MKNILTGNFDDLLIPVIVHFNKNNSNIDDFEKFAQDSVGASYSLEDILDNLEKEQIVELVNEYIETII